MVGTGVGASNGILIKSAAILEKISKIDAVVFDKTGSLTYGRLEVEEIKIFDDKNYKMDDIILLSASAESSSEHPLGVAIKTKFLLSNLAKTKSLFEPNDFTAVPGQGFLFYFIFFFIDFFFFFSGIVCLFTAEGNKKVHIGNRLWIEQQKITIKEEIERYAKTQETKGYTVVFVAIKQNLVAVFVIGDRLRKESVDVIRYLQKNNIETYMLTGDNSHTANHFAKLLSIDKQNVFSQVLPVNKAEKVKQLQNSGKMVYFLFNFFFCLIFCYFRLLWLGMELTIPLLLLLLM